MKCNVLKVILGLFFAFWIIVTGVMLAPNTEGYFLLPIIYPLSILASGVLVILISLNWCEETSEKVENEK